MPTMTKDRIEKMCRRAGLVPAERREVQGFAVVVADGFTATPSRTFNKFGIGKEDFPFGCYGTFWWALWGDDDAFVIAYPLFFDAFHDPSIPKDDKQRARVNAAFENADEFLSQYADRLPDARVH